MKIIDLSIPIEDGLPSDPPIQIPKIQYCNHKDTAEQMAGFFKAAPLRICRRQRLGNRVPAGVHPFRNPCGCPLPLLPHHERR
mgnify:CR=1 FL=1